MKIKRDGIKVWSAAALVVAAVCASVAIADNLSNAPAFSADDKRFEYMGRVDFTNPKLPRFWSPGVTVFATFRGTYCDVILNDQVLWGKSHNFVEVVVDGTPKRCQTTGASNIIRAADNLPNGNHTIAVCKDTESGIGYLEFAGLKCDGLASPPKMPKRKIEFIGDSITAGTGTDQSDYPCGQGEWYSQHNAYMSYGPKTARDIDAQWMLSAVSGIGLIHSCCGMTFTMPDVYRQIANRPPSDTYAAGESWDFNRYQPDVITVCLGQNDGTANPDKFVASYEAFVEQLRSIHPKAQIVLLTSPMGDDNLTTVMKGNLAEVVKYENDRGDKRVSTFFFSRSWHHGCGGHPSMDDDTDVAAELSAYLKTLMHW